jgi:tetratricopeptide (TPR) repeat protein
MNRASGRLARGELYLRRMDLLRALGEYQEAYGMDSSPLSKLNLAEAFLIGGRLKEAMLYAEDCLKADDESWMLNYGIDPVRYKRDIHEILKDTYEGLFRAEAFSAPGTAKEKAESFFRKTSYRFRWMVHTHLFRKYSLLAADAYGEIHQEALLQYFNAFGAYPRRALTYLKQARAFEEPLIPASVPTYDFDEGRLLKDRKILTRALEEFDPVWERDMIAEAYAELALKGKKAERQDAAERLFALNRGALYRNGIRLPVELRITGAARGTEGILRKAVTAAGMEPARPGAAIALRYTLTLDARGGGSIVCELYDGGRGISIFRQELSLLSSRGTHRAAFSRSLRDGVFSVF